MESLRSDIECFSTPFGSLASLSSFEGTQESDRVTGETLSQIQVCASSAIVKDMLVSNYYLLGLTAP